MKKKILKMPDILPNMSKWQVGLFTAILPGITALVLGDNSVRWVSNVLFVIHNLLSSPTDACQHIFKRVINFTIEYWHLFCEIRRKHQFM